MTDLSTVLESLWSGDTPPEKLKEIVSSPDVKKSINYIINRMSQSGVKQPYTEEEMLFIQNLINAAQTVYNNSGCETGLTDEEYDVLYEIFLANGGSDIVSAPVSPSAKNICYHKYPSLRGTLTKIFYLTNDEIRRNPSRRYLDEWKRSMENKILAKSGKAVNLDNYEVYVFPKFDGVSAVFEMTDENKISRVLTRGYTETNEAQDITHILKRFSRKHKEMNGAYGLKTEVMMYEKDLELYNKVHGTAYKNTRSIVSAILNSDEYDEASASLLHIVPLRVGDADGKQLMASEAFEDYPYLRCRLKDREAIKKFANAHKDINGLRCDGAVIYIIDEEIQEILGRENNKNNFEVAYKFTEEVAKTNLVDVEFNMGLFGRLAPVAKVEPVKLKGNTIEKVSLGSIGRLRNLNLCKGDEVKILYDIIPYLLVDNECSRGNGKPIKIPHKCPICGEELSVYDSGDIISCSNDDCPSKMKGKILNFLNKMNIDGISFGTINTLFEFEFVKSIEDLYSLKDHVKEIAKLPGMGMKSVTKILEAISSQYSVSDFVVLGALGIEGASKKTFEKIMKVMTMEELVDIVKHNRLNDLLAVPGIKGVTARNIIDGIIKNRKLLKFLVNELDIVQTKGNEREVKFSVAFTKVRDDELEKYILLNGGEIDDSIKRSTTLLIVPSLDTKSSKVEKAKKYGIPIIPIANAREAINKCI